MQKQESNSKIYNNIKLAVGISEGAAGFVLIFLFVSLGYSLSLEKFLYHFTSNDYFVLILFTAVIGIAMSIIFFPVKFYVEYYLEHKYNLSNQTILKWLLEDFKGLLVGISIGLPILLGFYWILNTFGNLWWLPFSILMFIISVVLSKILPVMILPIFYKIIPLNDEELKKRITKLASNVGMKVENVFSFDMSKNTKKANAAFTGLGKTKRIILGDTLLNEYTLGEIETVIAHELGHYKHKHIIKNIILSTVVSFATFFLIAVLYDSSLTWFGFSARTDVSALPLLTLWGMLIGLIISPITNIISRKFEYQADEYAVKVTSNAEIFIHTLKKLTAQNFGDENPHPFIEWYFYSHPSIKKRVNHVKQIMELNVSS